jgi:hypothetical protein
MLNGGGKLSPFCCIDSNVCAGVGKFGRFGVPLGVFPILAGIDCDISFMVLGGVEGNMG